MKIAKMARLSGADRYGSCTECNKSVTNNADALKIVLKSGVSVYALRKVLEKAYPHT